MLASHYDMAPAGNWESGEKFYHGLLLGLLAYLGAEYTVESNREYGMGRADIVLLKRSFGASPAEQAVLFELKQESADNNTPLEQLAQEAHSQAINGIWKASRQNASRKMSGAGCGIPGEAGEACFPVSGSSLAIHSCCAQDRRTEMTLEDLGYNREFENYRRSQNLDSFGVGRVISEHKESYIVKTPENEYDAEVIGNLRFSANERIRFSRCW